MSDYATFIREKMHHGSEHGFDPVFIPDAAFDFQRSVIEWDVRGGRRANFLDCGMGKTLISLSFAENLRRKFNRPVLMLTPIAVGKQTVNEGEKFGIECSISRDGKRTTPITISNYERLHYFRPDDFIGVICDESSILKNFDGATKSAVTQFLRKVPYRLLATATAAPNDYVELGTSSEALGELGHMDMLGKFFRNDENTCKSRTNVRTQSGISAGWRFKGHAEQAFWRWVCSWARAARVPSDLGPFSNSKFVLPALIEKMHSVECTKPIDFGQLSLIDLPAKDMREERAERRRSIEDRCEKAAELANAEPGASVIWCHLNDEGDYLESIVNGSKQICGKTTEDEKIEIFEAFSGGKLRKLIIKDKIGAWGLNWQHCRHVIRFATHSYEAYYQAIRRCWRFGQTEPVRVDLIHTPGEERIVENHHRKQAQADAMFTSLVTQMNSASILPVLSRATSSMELPTWLCQ